MISPAQRPVNGSSVDTYRILLSPPFVGELEKAAVARALDGGWVAPVGPDVDHFEEEIARRSGRNFAVALSSGTAGLHLALLALGVRPGDVVFCPTLTFVATANAIRYVGAEPIFIDSEEASGNVSPELLEHAIRDARAKKLRMAGVIAVDFLGKCADYETLSTMCDEHNLFLLSDAAESMGASYHARPAGSFGSAAVFSFNGNKIVTTSGGGALVTDDSRVAERARFLATQAREPAMHYEHSEVGYNYRMSNILAAIGRVQLERLSEFITLRKNARERYRRVFADVDGVEVFGYPDAEDNFWLTAILVNPEQANFDGASLSRHLSTKGIESRPLWKPMHLQPLFAECQEYSDGTAERLFRQGLALPSGSGLTEENLRSIEGAILDFLAVQKD